MRKTPRVGVDKALGISLADTDGPGGAQYVVWAYTYAEGMLKSREKVSGPEGVATSKERLFATPPRR